MRSFAPAVAALVFASQVAQAEVATFKDANPVTAQAINLCLMDTGLFDDDFRIEFYGNLTWAFAFKGSQSDLDTRLGICEGKHGQP